MMCVSVLYIYMTMNLLNHLKPSSQLGSNNLVNQKHTSRIGYHPQHVRCQSSIQRLDTFFSNDQLESLHQASIFLYTVYHRLT
jgi:hypothetical protein